MEQNDSQVILASSSPRRRYLLGLLGIPFEVEPAGADEAVLPGESPEDLAVRLARDKALLVSKSRPRPLVIGADTIVVVDGMILGKPKDGEDACRMLETLSGRTHRVITGVAVAHGSPAGLLSEFEETEVEFDTLAPDVIRAYVGTGEPMGKAGGYAIQGTGSILVKGIHGCYFNVVGLPLRRLSKMLAEFGVRVLQ